MLKGKCVVLGVTGSIAAYKIANLASMLVKLHADVHVIMTQNATNFINPITFETLTSHKCLVDIGEKSRCSNDCAGFCKCNRKACVRDCR